jgi:hypothetical protein
MGTLTISDMTKKEVFRKLNKEYKGKRLRLIQMNDEPNPVPPGTEGTIYCVDNTGTIHLKWDDGSELPVIIDLDDFLIL